jgi:hypothetical protein
MVEMIQLETLLNAKELNLLPREQALSYAIRVLLLDPDTAEVFTAICRHEIDWRRDGVDI